MNWWKTITTTDPIIQNEKRAMVCRWFRPKVWLPKRIASVRLRGMRGMDVVNSVQKCFELLDHERGPFHCTLSEDEGTGADATFINAEMDAGLRLLVFADNSQIIWARGLVYDEEDHVEWITVKRPRVSAQDMPYAIVKSVYALLDQWKSQ